MAEVLIAVGGEKPEPPFTLAEVLGILASSPEIQAREADAGVSGLLQSVIESLDGKDGSEGVK